MITAPAAGAPGLISVITSCGVELFFDGDHKALVKVPDIYAGSMTGMCGNCDGDPRDFITKQGLDVNDYPQSEKYDLFGMSFQVPDTSDAPDKK